jgi:hypothetical protein
MTSILEPPRTESRAAEPISGEPIGGPARSVRLRRRAAGTAIIAAGAISLAGFLTAPWEHGSDTAAYLRSLTGAPTQAMISMAILHYGYLLFVPTAFVLARLARRGAPRVAATGLVLSILGSGLSGFLVTDAYDLSIARHLPPGTAVQVSDGVSNGAMIGVALPTVFGAMLGLVVLLLAMWRARHLSVLPALLLVAGWLASFHAHGALRACTGFALVALALGWVGFRVLRMTDEQYAAG